MPIKHQLVAGNPQNPRVTNTDWNADHTNPDIADVTGLQTALDAKANKAGDTFTGAVTIQSNSAAALAVGPNGTTNPALRVKNDVASSATGWEVVPTSGSSVSLTAISSAADCEAIIRGKGNGAVTMNSSLFCTIQVAGSNIFSGTANSMTFSNVSRAFTSNNAFIFTGIAATGVPVSTEVHQLLLNFSATQSHQTGAITLQRDIRVRPSTHSFTAASTITDAAAFAVDGAPIAGTNAIFTNASSIYSAGQNVGAGTVNSYGLNVTANTGATNNYCTSYNGTAGEIFRVRTDGQIAFLATNTAAGTTGAQTINRPSGTVNFAAAATSLVVTNSLCTTSSIVFAVIRTNDATATIKNVVPAAGSFTINLNAAATAETSVGFFIIN